VDDVGDLVPLAPLRAFMDAAGLSPGDELRVERITTGHSCEVFRVERGGLRLALRRPPRTPLSPTAHNMEREHRLLSAFASAGSLAPPAPRPVALCVDAAVIGAPFYLMELVEGTVLRDHLPPAFAVSPSAALDAGFALVDALVDVHGFDWRRHGLDGFGKPDGYLDRQVPRWTAQLRAYQVRPLPEVEALAAWLSAHTPAMGPATLIHGDYKLDNVVLDPAPPPRIRAILDWEQATVGDPLVDVGWMVMMWPVGDGEGVPGGGMCVAGRAETPSGAELAARYAERSGRDVRELLYYEVLALFKLACVMEGSYARFVAGTSDDAYFATLEDGVPAYARKALALIDAAGAGHG
jgi:aminoglycoside phosphotransferase (APT) family kinase protein